MGDLADLLSLQSGVVSRRQAQERGLADHDLRRLVRRRELVVVHPGVLVSHTGPMTWLQRAWAGTLAVGPAALSHGSAVRAIEGPGRRDRDDSGPIHVAVDRHRRVEAPRGVRVHRMAGLDSRVVWNASPPRVRAEEALVDLAASAQDDWRAIETIASAVQSRLTTAARIRGALQGRERIARRAFIAGVLDDVEQGACSVLEHGYLTRVERAHGLPRAERQVRDSVRGPVYRDVDYGRFGLLVELDGRLFHDSATARDRDLDRDLDAAVAGRDTVRVGWGQVFDRGCLTAMRIGRLLEVRGWSGALTECPACTARWITATA